MAPRCLPASLISFVLLREELWTGCFPSEAQVRALEAPTAPCPTLAETPQCALVLDLLAHSIMCGGGHWAGAQGRVRKKKKQGQDPRDGVRACAACSAQSDKAVC